MNNISFTGPSWRVMNIYAQPESSNELFPINLEIGETLRSLKEKVAEEMEVDEDRILLYFEGEEIEEGSINGIMCDDVIEVGIATKDIAIRSLLQSGTTLSIPTFIETAKLGGGSLIPFIEAGIPVDSIDSNGRTALIYASWNGRLESCKELISFSANPNKTDDFYRTALTYAARISREEIVEYLLSVGADPNINGTGTTALMVSAQSGNECVCKMLIAAGADLRARWKADSALTIAAEYDQPRIVNILLEAGTDPNMRVLGMTALMVAARAGHREVCEILLRAGARKRIKHRGVSAFTLAAGNPIIINLLT